MSNITNNLTIFAAKINSVGGADDKNLENNITSILNNIILVLGLVAVIFVVVGGISYITSNGEAAKVEKAKKTILYACIGLIVCVLSFAIVNFVISNIIGGGSSKKKEEETSYIDTQTQNNIAFFEK